MSIVMEGTTSKLEAECFSVTKNYIDLKSCSETNIERILRQVFKHKRKLSGSQILSLTQLLLGLGSVLVTTITILYITGATQLYEPLDRYILDKVVEHEVLTVRTIRFVSTALFLYNLPQFQDAYTGDCYLANPFLEIRKNAPTCSLCQNVTEIPDFSGLSNDTFHLKYRHNGIPFVIKDALPASVEMDNLTKLLPRNLDLNCDYSHNKFEIDDKKVSLALWVLFKLPYFLPNQSELGLQQFVFIDGPSSSSYQLPFTLFGNVVLTQARGRRLITLIPTWRCKSTCSSVSIKLETGHALYYSLYFWRAMSQPTPDPTEAEAFSVINVRSFYL